MNVTRFRRATIVMILLIACATVFSQGSVEGADKILADLQKHVAELSAEIAVLKNGVEDPYRAIGAVDGYNPRAKYYEVPAGFPQIESRVRFLGNLRGTWREMGAQYGERAGDLIVTVYRYIIDYFESKEMSEKLLQSYARRYGEQVDAYAPEMMEFMRGIAEGTDWTGTSTLILGEMTPIDRVLLINTFLDLDFFSPRIGLSTGTPAATYSSDFLGTPVAGHCTGVALSGKSRGALLSPTKNGETIISNHYDLARFAPLGWNCAYIATPSDPKAHVFWSIQPAGMVGSQNISTNDVGVTIGSFFGGQSDDDAFGFGVIHPVLELHALVYADNARQAVDTMVFGSAEYRAKTGRTKVLQTGFWGYLVADRDEVMVLEVTPNRHAVRYPGDMGEKGNYVIYANWYGADHYYDANNKLVNQPIGVQPPEFPERYWTYDWFIRYHFGQLDEELVRDAQRSTYYYDKDTGQRIDNLEGTALPLYVGMHTISSYWGAALGLDIGGTIHAAQVILSPNGRSKINWVQGRPSEWVGPWQSVDLYGYQK